MNNCTITDLRIAGKKSLPPVQSNNLPNGITVIRFMVNEKKENDFNTWHCVAYGNIADEIIKKNLHFGQNVDITFQLDQEVYTSSITGQLVHRVVLVVKNLIVRAETNELQPKDKQPMVKILNLEENDPFLSSSNKSPL